MPYFRAILLSMPLMLSLALPPAAAAELTPVTDRGFKEQVVEASKAGPVVVFFQAPWCGPCRTVMPALRELADDFAGRVAFLSLDVDDSPEAAMTYSVASLPTLVIFARGAAADRKTGSAGKEELSAWIAPHAR